LEIEMVGPLGIHQRAPNTSQLGGVTSDHVDICANDVVGLNAGCLEARRQVMKALVCLGNGIAAADQLPLLVKRHPSGDEDKPPSVTVARCV
jgi:hypothetical protein